MAAAETPSAPPAAPAHPPWAATATEPEAAVARLAGGVAEGFDRVLGSVFAHLDRAAAALPARRKNVRDELEQARAALERAASLTRMLLAYGRRLTIDPEYVSINDVVAEAIPRLERRLRGRGTLKFEPGVHTGIVLADPIQLEQIVLTLCQRAVMTAASGATEVTVLSSLIPGRLVEPDPSRTRALEGRFARLRVVDNGSGIPPRHLPHIFDPFARTDRGRWGTGLELPMLQGIVAQHEGFVTAANREGGGAVFTIYLPAVDRAPARITRTPAEEAGGAERILLVEDDELVGTLAERVLADAGYIVESAADGQEAVDRVRDQGNTFDLAILDMIMPRMGGRAAYEELSAMAPELRFLFVSGYTMSADDAEFLSHHGRSFLPKPFNRGQLLREIRTLLDA